MKLACAKKQKQKSKNLGLDSVDALQEDSESSFGA